MSADQVFRVLERGVAGLLLLTSVQCATARNVRVSIARLAVPGVSVERARLELSAAQATVQFGAKLRLEAATSSATPVTATCALTYAAAGWRCVGETAVGELPATLLLQADTQQYLMQLTRKKTALSLALPKASPQVGATLTLTGLPLDWLQPMLASRWSEAKLGSGSLDVEASSDVGKDNSVSLRYTLRDAGLDTRDGSIALSGLSAQGKVVMDWRNALRVHHVGVLHDAELLWGSFYGKLPATPISLDFDAVHDGASAWRVERIRYDDKAALLAELTARVDTASPGPLSELHLRNMHATFPVAYERYAKALLSTRGFGDLSLHGELIGSAKWEGDAIVAFGAETKGLDVADGAGRFAIDGIEGSLTWDRERELPTTSLSFQAARVYRLVLGSTRTQWHTKDGNLTLAAPTVVPFAGGTLEIPQLAVRPDAAKGERWRAAFAAHDIDIGSVSEALGWPRFVGKLGGAVPAIRYVGEHIELDGGLFLHLFDGSVNITHLALERPFGVAPSLAADIALENLDLLPLTAAFGFGEITGRLSGRIDALRTVNWSPVSFDAELHTDGNGKLSQRAVNNLTSVGGGGLAAGLQARMLRVFDTFGYDRIGLRCRLHDNVCRMGGIDSSGSGYTIVEGRGLPHVTVVGHQSDVDWPTLVARLKAATSGTAPIIH